MNLCLKSKAAGAQYIFEDRLFLLAEWSEPALKHFNEDAWTSPDVHNSAAERHIKGVVTLSRLLFDRQHCHCARHRCL